MTRNIIIFWLMLVGTVAARFQPPNLIVIMVDDQGYSDVGCFGAEGFSTPHLDQMAREGLRCTSFYAHSTCSPTRAAFLTGRYAQRCGIGGPLNKPNIGLPPEEITLPELLKPAGYTSALIGKWHLGLHDSMSPIAQGFDYFSGIPLSQIRHGLKQHEWYYKRQWKTMSAEGETTVEYDPDDTQFTQRCTREAINFITAHRDQPFFLFLAHPMVHYEVVASEAFRGKSERGIYGDACQELDDSVGQLLAALKQLKLDEKTMVVYCSDNGPWLKRGYEAQHGRAKGLRGGKFSCYEGGVRVPFIARWSGHIPAGQTFDGLATIMDLFPTFARQAQVALPKDRVLDGQDFWPVLSGKQTKHTQHEYFYYRLGQLRAVRHGPWKMHYRKDGGIELFNLDIDLAERKNVADAHPEVIEQIEVLAQSARIDLGDKQQPGKNTVPMGFVAMDLDALKRAWKKKEQAP